MDITNLQAINLAFFDFLMLATIGVNYKVFKLKVFTGMTEKILRVLNIVCIIAYLTASILLIIWGVRHFL